MHLESDYRNDGGCEEVEGAADSVDDGQGDVAVGLEALDEAGRAGVLRVLDYNFLQIRINLVLKIYSISIQLEIIALACMFPMVKNAPKMRKRAKVRMTMLMSFVVRSEASEIRRNFCRNMVVSDK